MTRKTIALTAALAALTLTTALPAAAQNNPVRTPVTGAQLQQWFDTDQFTIAGVNVLNQCFFIARGTGIARSQTVYCPTMAQPFTVVGEAKVVGDQVCSKFSYPDGSKLDACQDVVKVGDNKYELRTGTTLRSVIYRLIP